MFARQAKVERQAGGVLPALPAASTQSIVGRRAKALQPAGLREGLESRDTSMKPTAPWRAAMTSFCDPRWAAISVGRPAGVPDKRHDRLAANVEPAIIG